MRKIICMSAIIISMLAFVFPLGASGISLVKIGRIDINPVEAVNSDGQVVYAGVGGALNIYNIYQRDFPQLVGTIEGHSSRITSIAVQNDKLIVLWEKEGLEVYDITDRYLPVLLGKFPMSPDERFSHFTTMDIEGNVAYLGGKGFVASVDLGTPMSLALMNYTSINCEPMEVDYYNNRLFVAAGRMGLGAFFVSNPYQFQLIGTQQGIYTTVKGYRDLILYGRLDEPKPNEPTIFGKRLFSFPFQSPMVVKINGDVIYAGGLSNFATYLLPEGETNPKQIWNLPNMPTVDCVLRDDVIYLANLHRGLSVFDVSNVYSPMEIGRLETYDVPKRGCINGDELFVAAGLSGVLRFDISNPRYPQLLQKLSGKLFNVWDCEVVGDHIYILGAREEIGNNVFIEKYDLDGNWISEYGITHASKLEPIGEMVFSEKWCAVSLGSEGIFLLERKGQNFAPAYNIVVANIQFCDMEFRDDLLFASDYKGGYHIYRIGNGLPREIGFIKTSDEGGNGIAIVGKYLLAADGPAGLTVINIRNPQKPEHALSIPTVWGTDIDIYENYAILSDGQGACKVFDISRLPDLTLVAELPRNGYWMHVYAKEGLIFGIDEFFGVHIYELRTPIEFAKESPIASMKPCFIDVFPNPFNAETRLSFEIPEKMNVDVSIIDGTGRKVCTLISDMLPQGNYTLRWDAKDVPSGIYFAVMKTPVETAETRLMLIK